MPDWFSQLVTIGGLPFALVCLALWGGHRGYWVWRREITREQEMAVALEKVTAALLDKERKGFEHQMTELRTDRDYYRAIAFEALKHTERLASGVERAITVEEREGRQR